LKGKSVFVDPCYDPSFFIPQLDVLPFLIDNVIIYNPSKRNLKRWRYKLKRFSEFVDAGIFVPLSPEDELLIDYPSEFQLTRKDIITTKKFLAEYDRAVEYDLDDEKFLKIAKSLSKRGVVTDPHDVAFSLNWDLIVTSTLGIPIIYDERQKALWNYKIGTGMGTVKKTDNITDIKQATVVKKFFYKTIGRLPIHLSVDDILEFRKNKAAKNFRRWLRKETNIAIDAQKVTQIKIEEHLYKEYKELIDSYQKKKTKTSTAVKSVIAVIVGFIAGPAVGAASLGAEFAVPHVYRTLQSKYGHNNWALLLVKMKKNSI
jgi:hypothetical protein